MTRHKHVGAATSICMASGLRSALGPSSMIDPIGLGTSGIDQCPLFGVERCPLLGGSKCISRGERERAPF